MRPEGTGDSNESHVSGTDEVLTVAGWAIDPSTLRIARDGKTTKLERLTMEVLMYMAVRPGQTISREEFEREIWGEQVVVYQALSNTIGKLRKAFDDDPNDPTIIETIPKIGYRLIAEVSSAPADAAPSGQTPGMHRRPIWVTAAAGVLIVAVVWFSLWRSGDTPVQSTSPIAAVDDKPAIAVLPFTNMSDDPAQNFFADGMTDDLITDLANVSGLFVLSRNSTSAYKGKPVDIPRIAEELGVDYVLEGSVRRAGGQVRVNAQLIDARTGRHVWAERYDESMSDIFALQDQVTESIVAALAVNLTAEDKTRREKRETDNPEAYEALLRGRARFELGALEDLPLAVEQLKKAIALDPGYSRAHAVLAETYRRAWANYDPEVLGLNMEEADRLWRAHLDEAMKNPTPRAHGMKSRALTADLRFEEAVEQAERAVALDPSDVSGYRALARVLNKSDRPAEALDAMRMALRLNPSGKDNGTYLWRLGESYYLLGRYEEAAAMAAEEIEVGDYWGNFLLAAALGQLGREEEARAAVEKFDAVRLESGKRIYTLAHLDGWGVMPVVRERWAEGLRKAGMAPGGSSSPVFAGVHTAPEVVEGAPTIDAAKAKSLFDAGILFVDVSGTDKEWKTGHIPGAIHLHIYHDFSESGLAASAERDQEIVIYAQGETSSQSARASARAVLWGFERVSYFRGGFPAWKAAGYPVEVPPD